MMRIISQIKPGQCPSPASQTPRDLADRAWREVEKSDPEISTLKEQLAETLRLIAIASARNALGCWCIVRADQRIEDMNAFIEAWCSACQFEGYTSVSRDELIPADVERQLSPEMYDAADHLNVPTLETQALILMKPRVDSFVPQFQLTYDVCLIEDCKNRTIGMNPLDTNHQGSLMVCAEHHGRVIDAGSIARRRVRDLRSTCDRAQACLDRLCHRDIVSPPREIVITDKHRNQIVVDVKDARPIFK